MAYAVQDKVSRPLAVVAVTYNSADTLGGLLDSLSQGLEGIARYEIVIVDNASSDNSIEIAENHPIGVRVIATGRNGGYAAGINAAAATISVDTDMVILNPDIRLMRGSLARLVKSLDAPGIGISVPKILHEDGTLFHSLRREPSIMTAWTDALLGTRLGYRLDRGECVCNDRRYGEAGTVDWASGAALAVSARARAAIGDWDESFFLYSEEVDFQRRCRAAGFGIAFVPDASVIHIGGDYSRNARLYGILTTNRIRDYGRHHGRLSTACFQAAVLTGEMLRSLRGSSVHRAGIAAAWRGTSERSPASPRLATAAPSNQ